MQITTVSFSVSMLQATNGQKFVVIPDMAEGYDLYAKGEDSKNLAHVASGASLEAILKLLKEKDYQ